jgi:hypothetical protein
LENAIRFLFFRSATVLEIAGYAVKTLESKETRALKKTTPESFRGCPQAERLEGEGNAQFSLCCTSTAMPDDDSQDRHPAFCFWSAVRIRKAANREFDGTQTLMSAFEIRRWTLSVGRFL